MSNQPAQLHQQQAMIKAELAKYFDFYFDLYFDLRIAYPTSQLAIKSIANFAKVIAIEN
jgi:hypothetical protein